MKTMIGFLSKQREKGNDNSWEFDVIRDTRQVRVIINCPNQLNRLRGRERWKTLKNIEHRHTILIPIMDKQKKMNNRMNFSVFLTLILPLFDKIQQNQFQLKISLYSIPLCLSSMFHVFYLISNYKKTQLACPHFGVHVN